MRLLLLTTCAALWITTSCSRKAPAPPAERKPQQVGCGPVAGSINEMLGVGDKKLHVPLIDPEYVSGSQADTFLDPEDIVFVVRAGAETYVYPEVVLSVHHVVNDTLNGRPVAVTYCMLAGSAILYSRSIGGRLSSLGSLATLYRGSVVLYDFETDSYWLQLCGQCVDGEQRGKRLENLGALERMPWSAVRGKTGVRILPPRHEVRFYREFVEEVRKEQLGLVALKESVEPDPRLPPYTAGLGVVVHGEACFFREEPVRQEGIFQDTVGGWSLLLVADAGTGVVRMFRRYLDDRVLTFCREGDAIVDDETGSRWNLRGICTEGELEGRRLTEPGHTRVFWFAWSALFPHTSCEPDTPAAGRKPPRG